MYKIYNKDCLDIMNKMPDKCIDLIVTDPPYENELHGGGKNELSNRKLMKDKHIDFMSKGFDYNVVFSEFLRLCKTPNMLIFCSNNQVSKVMSWFESKKIKTTLLVWRIVWHKTNPTPSCNGHYLSDLEFVVYVHGKGSTFNNDCPFEYKHKAHISPIVSNKNRLHPAQKPIELLEKYIMLHSNKNDIVFDPFMGSGSTGVAAIANDRSFVGCEINEEYFNIAKERIENCKGEY